jgi:hypothetical protein
VGAFRISRRSEPSAGLREIYSVGGMVEWASGTDGIVLRSADDAAHWTKWSFPDIGQDNATLNFRGVRAWDATTAIIIAFGTSDESHLYKAKDGCRPSPGTSAND